MRRSPESQASLPDLVAESRRTGGDLGAFSELVRRYQDLAFAAAFAMLRDRARAEDAAQEAFLSAWRALGQLREPEAFPGWLVRIVRNQCHRALRADRVPVAPLDDAASLAEPSGDPEADVVQRERSRSVQAAVSALPEHLRTTVSLFYLGDCSVKEIAELQELKPGTVKKRLFDARARLRDHLEEEHPHMAEDHLRESRPSRDARFAKRVVRALQAAARGDVATVRELVEADRAIANAPGPHPIWGGEPQPLHVAAERNHLSVVRELVERGADLDGGAASYDGWSPLMLAAHGGRLGIHAPRSEVVELLIARGATVDIFAASLLGDVARVSALLDANGDLARATGPAAATPLHFARDPEVARLLLAAGADPNVRCGWGTSPLERASFCGSAGGPVAEVLIAAGALPHVCAYAGLGALDPVRERLDADPGALSERHKVAPPIVGTPLHAAAQWGQVEMAALLLDRGADIDARADHGQTPLHLALNSLDVVELLVACGADLDARDADHQTTPLAWARFHHENLDPGSPELPRVIAYLERRAS